MKLVFASFSDHPAGGYSMRGEDEIGGEIIESSGKIFENIITPCSFATG
jgi:hypothetical protein